MRWRQSSKWSSVNLFLSIASTLGNRLPPRLAVPLRARFGPSRELEPRLIDALVKPGDVCVDVGANKGTWTYPMAQAVGPLGLVLAVEPQRALRGYLERAFSERREVVVVPVALSDHSRSATLAVPVNGVKSVPGRASLTNEYSESIVEQVFTDTMDHVLQGLSPALIKIDVEGHEWEVIQGATQTLRNAKPSMVIEMLEESPGASTSAVFNLLVNTLGYHAFDFDGSTLKSVRKWPSDIPRNSPNIVFIHSEVTIDM